MRHCWWPLVVATACCLGGSEAKAADGCKNGPAVFERAQFDADLGLSLGGAAVFSLGEFAILQGRRDQWVPAIDRKVPVNGSGGAAVASDLLVYGSLAAASGWAVYGTVRCWRSYTLKRSRATPILELVWPYLWTLGFTGITKSWVGRPRPYTRGDIGFTGRDVDLRSFPSGHSSSAALLTTITVASGLRWTSALSRPLPRLLVASGAGFGFGVTTGAMRVLAAKHHWSDVLVGAALGTAIGVLPVATERIGRKRVADVAVSPRPNGAAVSGRF